MKKDVKSIVKTKLTAAGIDSSRVILTKQAEGILAHFEDTGTVLEDFMDWYIGSKLIVGGGLVA